MDKLKEHKKYYTNGNICRHGYLKNGFFEKEYKGYYIDGSLWLYFFYMDNLREGEYISFNLRYEKRYKRI